MSRAKLEKYILDGNIRGDIFFQIFLPSSIAYLLALSIRSTVLVMPGLPRNFLLLKTINLSLFNIEVLYYSLLFIL